ncbi:MAG: T9SS type A sorting domain-containing protein [Bacteroidales bacterium]|nr:T9SS type A sorting domain-containing protein [Bacteroidales bacterium]
MNAIHYNRIVMVLCFIIFLSSLVRAQEVLTGVASSRQMQKSATQTSSGYPDTLSLPFIDDFARGVGYPFDGLWKDNYGYMNYQYAVNPPSIGVMTLDALDENGRLYSNANNTGFEADEFTSKPVDLDLQPSDSVYLSFYYQPGGRCDTSGGEFQDSLVLQYYSPGVSQWKSVWSASYSEEDTLYERNYFSGNTRKIFTDSLGHRKFYQTIIPVRKKKLLQKGFQFRFKNYASIADTNDVPSMAGNVDHWHLDFIRLNKNRTHKDTTINDIAFVKPLSSLLINYESIPWKHFPQAEGYEMGNRLSITYRNLDDTLFWNISSREFEIIDRMWDNETQKFTGGVGDDIPPFALETYSRSINYIFPYNGRDSALFEIRSYLVTDTVSERAPYRWNDTIRYIQKFYNYYAYDDGTAENGYGIPGIGSENARVAFRFRTYAPDTLQAIQIYFNQTLNHASRNSFKLMIWEDDNGKPGEVIYEQQGFKPVYEDSLNQFNNYVLKEKPFLDAGYFFIGYQKFNQEMLNVGFDANNVNNDKMFYNKAGTWLSSQVEGTLMMRPVFGDHIEYVGTSAEEEPKPRRPEIDFNIYPNPANNQIHIDLEKDNYRNFTYSIFDVQGRAVVKDKKLKRTVYLNNLPAGMYLLKLRNRLNRSVEVKKFLIRK